MAKTSQRNNTSVQQLGEALLTVGGTAKSLAGGVTEANTVLGIFADSGTKERKAEQHYKCNLKPYSTDGYRKEENARIRA